jgi:hypothetical protein
MFGNVSEWCVGAGGEPVALGGNAANQRPKQLATVPKLSGPSLAGDQGPIKAGSPNIGFRCVLRPPPR